LLADGTLALLSWFGDGECRLRLFDRPLGTLGPAQTLAGAAFRLCDRLARTRAECRVSRGTRLPGRRDAPVWVPRGVSPRLR
jgi:hypothetical protein